MFTKKAIEPTALDLEIETVQGCLALSDPSSERYDKVSTQYVKLLKARAETQPRVRLSPDTIALIAANLAGILIVVGYEHAHVVTSKALGFVGKLR